MSDQELPPEEPARDNGEQGGNEQTITITLKATLTPSGYRVGVEIPGPPLFDDTVIDICLRVARFYERMAMIRQAQASQAQVQQVTGMVRDLERGGHGAAPFRRFHG